MRFRLHRRKGVWEMWLGNQKWCRMQTGTLRECVDWCFFERYEDPMRPAELHDQVRFTSSNSVIEGKVVQAGSILVVRATDGRRWAVGSGDVLVLEDAHS